MNVWTYLGHMITDKSTELLPVQRRGSQRSRLQMAITTGECYRALATRVQYKLVN